MNTDTPLVCNMGVFTPAQREAHVRTTAELIQSVQSLREAENGYEFTFPNETELLTKIAEFISKERLCCPFLQFSLTILTDKEPISLALTGPLGTQEFLRGEFEGAFQ